MRSCGPEIRLETQDPTAELGLANRVWRGKMPPSCRGAASRMLVRGPDSRGSSKGCERPLSNFTSRLGEIRRPPPDHVRSSHSITPTPIKNFRFGSFLGRFLRSLCCGSTSRRYTGNEGENRDPRSLPRSLVQETWRKRKNRKRKRLRPRRPARASGGCWAECLAVGQSACLSPCVCSPRMSPLNRGSRSPLFSSAFLSAPSSGGGEKPHEGVTTTPAWFCLCLSAVP